MASQWMQDARSHAYHAGTPRSDVRDKVATCRFLHTQCDKQLFTSEYLRSNKASGHKNLRCFPHCCGGHNPKSFCGSGLVIECLVPNCQLVLGRFEEVAKQQPVKSDAPVDTKQRHGSLVVGHDYARQELFDDVKMPDQPFGQWFRGSAVPNGTTAGTCFLLNGNRQSWHYGWQSSRLNCKNLHVFKVYVFEARGKAATLTCVASLASPAFRISSSRKARKTFRSPAGTLLPPHVLPPATPGRDGPQNAANMDLFLASGHKPVASSILYTQCPPSGFLAPPDPARRERKRLTRSASLKTDYFSTVSFPRHQSHPSSQPTSLAATHPLPVNATRFSMPSLPVLTDPTTDRPYHSRRSSLAALPMPVSQQRPMPVLTPITGMMHLRLESPTPFPHTASAPLSSAMGWTSGALHPYASTSARPYPFVRRDTWSSSWQTKAGEGKGLTMMQLPSTVASESYLNRKRNRSTDSDKAITAAIEASEKIHPTLSPISSPGAKPVVAPVPTDSALYQRARILQLALTIVKRIHRFEEVAKPASPKVIRHSFEMITPPVPVGPVPTKCTLVLVPLSKSKLLQLCSNLVTVCTALVASGVLEDMRQKLRDCAQAGRGILAAYQQLVDLLTEAVEAQVARLPRCKADLAANASEWNLYELLKSCEPWLVHEPWWVVLDPDTQAQAGDREEGAVRPLPYLHVFADYYHAIHDAVPSPDDVQVAASLRKAALTGATGLTGEWNRQGELDDQHLQPPQRVASVRSATAASSLSWLARCIHAHTTKTLHVTETETTMTLSLPNSLISADAVFLVHLDQPEPTVVMPHDYFPFGWSRTRALIAYRAWRVRGIDDANGSAVAIQFMRWPDAHGGQGVVNDEEEDVDEMEAWPEEPEEEPRRRNGPSKRLRTRITIYFSVFSTTMLQLRTIVEASLAPVAVATSTTHPTEMDMRKYFKSPSSWEMRSQISQQYTKNL